MYTNNTIPVQQTQVGTTAKGKQRVGILEIRDDQTMKLYSYRKSRVKPRGQNHAAQRKSTKKGGQGKE